MKHLNIGLIFLTMLFLFTNAVRADAVSYTKNGYTLVVNTIDSAFPATTRQKMIDTFFTVYPAMAARFNANAAKTVYMTIDPSYSGVAYAQGTTITFSSAWLKNNPGDTDTVTHEGFHLVQAYTGNSIPGWATEGLADYARNRYGINNAAGNWSLPNFNAKQKYTDSYRVTGRFFTWLELTYGTAIIEKLNLSGRNNNYNPNLWVTWTGKTIDQLWADYAAHPELVGVSFYQDANFGGRAVQLGLGNYPMAQMTGLGIPNDWVSSLKVPAGWVVEIYQNHDFTGTKWTYSANTSYVGAECNDKMSAVKISVKQAVFYLDAGFTGSPVALGKGNYTLAQLQAAGIPNDKVSSLRVPAGWTVEIYQDDNFAGTKWTFTADTSYVGAACNDKLSSVRIY